MRAVANSLRCPYCHRPLAAAPGRRLTCGDGHSFDVARQGYVALSSPGRRPLVGDTPGMLAARAAFLDAGHYAPIADAIAAAAHDIAGAHRSREHGRPLLVDVGAGTGHYLAAALDAVPGAAGVALDASRHAVGRAVRAHPAIAAVRCDVWRGLPITDHAATVLLNAFAPRNGAEMARVLSPGGALIVVTPTGRHLRQLVALIGTVSVDPEKDARLRAALAAELELVERRPIEFDMTLPAPAVDALIGMGPMARHDRGPRLEAGPLVVTASVNVDVLRPLTGPRGTPQARS